MKRRDFVLGSAGVLGSAFLPRLSSGAPCPPPEFSAVGGTSVASACADSTLAEADWIARSTGPGVVWAHDFRYEREVSQFRSSDDVRPYAATFTGIDPDSRGVNTIHWDATDGIGQGKCLRTVAPNGLQGFPEAAWWENVTSASSRVHFPVGTKYVATDSARGTFIFPDGSRYSYVQLQGGEPPTDTTALFDGEKLKHEGRVSAGGWARPFSALVQGEMGNGLPYPDRASNGEKRRTFDASRPSAFYDFRAGYYGNAAYHSAGGGGSTQADWDGTEFYLQFRVKISRGRHAKRVPPPGANSSNADVSSWLRDGVTYEYMPPGKLAFIQPGPEQLDGYVIIQSGAYQRYSRETAAFRMYSDRGVIFLQDPQSGSPNVFQNAGPYAATCTSTQATWNLFGGKTACFEWPEEEWVTVLFYMKPGRDNTPVASGKQQSEWPYKDTHVKAWVARQGQTTYTPVFDKSDLAFVWGMGSRTPVGSVNNVDFSCYMNNMPAWKAFEQKYTQVVFSKSFIPCPAV